MPGYLDADARPISRSRSHSESRHHFQCGLAAAQPDRNLLLNRAIRQFPFFGHTASYQRSPNQAATQ